MALTAPLSFSLSFFCICLNSLLALEHSPTWQSRSSLATVRPLAHLNPKVVRPGQLLSVELLEDTFQAPVLLLLQAIQMVSQPKPSEEEECQTSTATLQFIHLAMDVPAHSLWEFQDQMEWTGQVQLPTMVQVCLLRQVPLHYLHTIRANQANVEGQEAQIISPRSSWNIVNALYRLFETLRGCFSVVEPVQAMRNQEVLMAILMALMLITIIVMMEVEVWKMVRMEGAILVIAIATMLVSLVCPLLVQWKIMRSRYSPSSHRHRILVGLDWMTHWWAHTILCHHIPTTSPHPQG